nr:extracellular solute-binding protein [Lachnospiraceae bacterium]
QTDAFTTDKVKIVAIAPEGSCKKVIYPVGIVKATKNPEAAQAFLAFLKSDTAKKVFEKYGF